ncbi:DinB family protein [Fulvivirga sp. RKSG066]|uniref:mycothiol transferase n=1 Tax=Fulvivirga aurantia TaxID=2529383 RepID=UPI0012BC2AE6|nr:DUF664 domain-containing protein [Fulvivirga aurantia]MTI19628.1 DinB family protein [Fulvivirga aurantia]
MKKLCLAAVLLICCLSLYAQPTIIEIKDKQNPHISTMIMMLDDLKNRITNQVKHLSQEETDFLMDDEANRMGALIIHLAATEMYYQQATFYDGNLNDASEEWNLAMDLGDEARDKLKDKPIDYYLNKWDEVRAKSKQMLKTKDDEWFLKIRDDDYNYYWAWFHVMEHQANHMGQIAMIKKRMKD